VKLFLVFYLKIPKQMIIFFLTSFRVHIKAMPNISSWEEGYVEKKTFYAIGMSSGFAGHYAVGHCYGRNA
jgi:hypothetical protein